MSETLTELVKLANGDPQVAQIAQLLAQREEALTRELAEREAEESARDDEARGAAFQRERLDELRRIADGLAGEIETLRSSLDTVAAALGACPSCWGDDPACRWCRGRGQPGSIPPDPETFELLVVPAVRLHAQLHRRVGAEPDPHLAQRRSTT